MKKIISIILSSALAFAAFANDKNTHRVSVGYASGGLDTVVRNITSDVEANTGRRFVVTNKPGANGQIAMREYFEKTNDTDLIAIVGGNIMIEPLLNPENNRLNALKAVGPIFYAPVVLGIAENSKSPVKTLEDLFNKNVPAQKLNIAVAGELYELAVKIIAEHSHHDIQAVRFKGSADGTTALLGGHVDMQIDAFGWFKPRLPAVKMLGVANATAIEGVTSMHKFIPGFTMSNFFGLAIYKNVPSDELAADMRAGFIKANRLEFYNKSGFLIDMNEKSDFVERRVIPDFNRFSKYFKK